MHRSRALVLALLLPALAFAQTPVIGGACKIGSADVQIGGKQTQFFLKCEATSESSDGDGVWVVKSRAATPTPAATAQPLPTENTQAQQHPKITMRKHNPNICEQDNGAREGDSCAVSATCLQANLDQPTTFLQCEQSAMRWLKKGCQEGYVFNFEQQACIVPKRMHSLSRQQANGLLCTYSACSNSNPCQTGSCNNGYCCSSGGSSSNAQIILASPQSSGCNGCQQQAPQIITIPVSQCPGGSPSYGTCSSGYCATGYSCVQGSCCPSNNQAQQSITVYTCPGGGSSVGQCVQGSCASGYQCSSQNTCCPSTNAYVCPDGTQAAGGCVNGLCGSGYSCSNGLCCASTSNQPKCLDGSPAVGACIPSCQGNGCGGTTLTYYCGTGYTCTTGNICCPVNSCPDGGEAIGPTVNGLCPTGYVAQGTQCCSIVNSCPDGAEYVGAAINDMCPPGTTLSGTSCCRTSVVFAQLCTLDVQFGPCLDGLVDGDPCSPNPGFACRADAPGGTTAVPICCPVVDYTESEGPCVPNPDTGAADSCAPDATPVFVAGDCLCVSLQTVPGLCAEADQSGPCISGTCPTGTCNVIADICCITTMAMSRRRTTEPPRSIFSSRPRSALAGADSPCPNGDMPVSSCMNGLCGAGLQCVRDVCCPISPDRMVVNSHKIGSGVERPIKMCPSGDEARSTCFADGTCGEGLACVQGLCCTEAEPNYNTNMNMNRPSARFSSSGALGIGSACSSNRQCAGYEGGLSKCERRVCRCTSVAYAKGIACVRKKMLMFNDEPVPVESSADTNSVVAPPS